MRAALRNLDGLYPQPTGASALSEVSERLAAAAPVDLAAVDLATYRGLISPWNDWRHLSIRGREWGKVVAALALEPR